MSRHQNGMVDEYACSGDCQAHAHKFHVGDHIKIIGKVGHRPGLKGKSAHVTGIGVHDSKNPIIDITLDDLDPDLNQDDCVFEKDADFLITTEEVEAAMASIEELRHRG